ncbi:nucleotidyltransferase domain-containing protein [Actinokineospora sp. NBRC 105648]|uniref:nucleotidyltransferase domain-containing protein n=1 Tax=Actinokineospora sp. NBRC 105648 TaxID=3032206 RepID=UPI0024A23137|nr:nucleotidyltransferase domain-containing protein [Actinokineospora sp. NBRC 105648]GLZ41369.1 nucleotidyltransferase [Actinokineospora sp. NBRC 105648]
MLPAVTEITDHYLRVADEVAPGLVTGLHLTGSVALGAWRPPHSDIDAVVVTSRPADAVELAAVHARVPALLECVYLDEETFATQPADGRVVPFSVDGKIVTDRPCGNLNPVQWLTLRRYGIAVRGELPDYQVSLAELWNYNLVNLREYWAPLAERARRTWPADGDAIAWLVQGPARLHYTRAKSDVISKAAAGRYLAALFPQWAALAERVERFRENQVEMFTERDLDAAADSVEAMVEDAWAQWGR